MIHGLVLYLQVSSEETVESESSEKEESFEEGHHIRIRQIKLRQEKHLSFGGIQRYPKVKFFTFEHPFMLVCFLQGW